MCQRRRDRREEIVFSVVIVSCYLAVLEKKIKKKNKNCQVGSVLPIIVMGM